METNENLISPEAGSLNIKPINGKKYEADLLLKEIKQAIESTRYTATSLAMKAGVDPKTVRKLIAGDYKKAPNAETIQRILSVLSGKKTVVDIANHYEGEIQLFLKAMLPHYFGNQITPEIISEDIIAAITDYVSYHIVKVSSLEAGIDKTKLIETISIILLKKSPLYSKETRNFEEAHLFNEVALKRINNFIKEGILVELDHNKVRLSVINIKLPFNIVTKYFADNIEFCDPSRWDLDNYFTRIKFGGASREDAQRAIIKVFNAYVEAAKILDNSPTDEIPLQIISSVESMEFYK